jgi:RND family efflux transporter MFP subunit
MEFVMEVEQQTRTQTPLHQPSAPEVITPQGRPRRTWAIAAVLILLIVAVFIYGILKRRSEQAGVRADTAQMSDASVSVVTPQRTAPKQEIVLPGNVQPFVAAPIYSRTPGYLKKWYVDIGARVKKGQLLAVIETPEVDQQLAQSRSNLATANANLRLAEITKNRYTGLLKTHAVSQQDADNAVGTYGANKAIVDANSANVRQLEALQSFEKIYAPFDGIITARNIDIGSLINSGSAGGVRTDLFHLSHTETLRVYINVPEEFAKAITPGLPAELSMAAFPGRRFPGKVVRTAAAINEATRTLITEVDVENPQSELFSGSFTEVHLNVTAANSLIVPVASLLFRTAGLQVAVVKDGKVVLTPVTAGHDFGQQIEIVSGLKGDETVIMNPPDSITNGQKVQISPAVKGETR